MTAFRANRAAYRSGGISETDLRVEYLDPFFKALGWDVRNEAGMAPDRKDVIRERATSAEGGTKFIDYCMRVEGKTRMFVEAKRPSVHILSDMSAAFQLRSYAWNANLPASVLTDFEEFAVYDTRVEPRLGDGAQVARLRYLTFEDYVGRWDEIVSLVSRDAVRRGSLTALVREARSKGGTDRVDDVFLEDIGRWRKVLAESMVASNSLSQDELNAAVQLTIDRIIFLRVCEDRHIEPFGRLRDTSARSKGKLYASLVNLFKQADDKYNSGLFFLKKDRGREEDADSLTPRLTIDDEPLRDVIADLYLPRRAYNFSIISPEILGQVYERFLGKEIVVRAGGRVEVVEREEVRKAGGVYYTPTYVVDGIVDATLGNLCVGKTPAQVKKIRVVDPSCGSGSFLLGAYQFLLDWHLRWYMENNPTRRARSIYLDQTGEWRLSVAERKQILLNNIFGVDLDARAVEVTKLSLLTKVLEGETDETLKPQLALFNERALPDLGKNIQCGNSLIDAAVCRDLPTGGVRREEVFDWQARFPEVFSGGGFDAVIGNPPYVLLQNADLHAMREGLARHYVSARYKVDTYALFMERAATLARRGGYVAFITPNSYLRNEHARHLRELLLTTATIDLLRVFFYPVFEDASVDTAVAVLRMTPPSEKHRVRVELARSLDETEPAQFVAQGEWRAHPEMHFSLANDRDEKKLLAKIKAGSFPLGEIADAYFGIQTLGRAEHVSERRLSAQYQPVIDGTNINRYDLQPPTEFVRFVPAAIKSGGNKDVYAKARVGVRQIGEVPVATLLPSGLLTLNTIYNVYLNRETDFAIEFVLAVVNSALLRWFWRKEFFDQKRTFPKVKKPALLAIPMPRLDMARRADAALHDEVVRCVRRLIGTEGVSRATGRSRLEVDAQLDALIFRAFGWTKPEIELVTKADAAQTSRA